MRGPRCAPSDEQGSIALGLALAALVLVLSLAVAAVGAGVGAYVSASNAADAAALAAAPVTFQPFGARGGPAQEAARFAALNGARLVSCTCPVDRSWDTRTVIVRVARRLAIPGVGSWQVRATSRATFEPVALLPGRGTISPEAP
jgi:methionine-rich copper-binding protein CopC